MSDLNHSPMASPLSEMASKLSDGQFHFSDEEVHAVLLSEEPTHKVDAGYGILMRFKHGTSQVVLFASSIGQSVATLVCA